MRILSIVVDRLGTILHGSLTVHEGRLTAHQLVLLTIQKPVTSTCESGCSIGQRVREQEADCVRLTAW